MNLKFFKMFENYFTYFLKYLNQKRYFLKSLILTI